MPVLDTGIHAVLSPVSGLIGTWMAGSGPGHDALLFIISLIPTRPTDRLAARPGYGI